MANFSFLSSGSNLYKPTPDPYQGAGYYTRTPGQELLELRAKTQDRARQIYEEAQLKKERERQNFLATVAGPQNLFEAPRDPRERAVQELVNADIMGRRDGVEMAPKWDAFRNQRILQDLQVRSAQDEFAERPFERQLKAAAAQRQARESRLKAGLDIAQNTREAQKLALDRARRERELALKEDEFDAKAEDADYEEALNMIELGVDPAEVMRMFDFNPETGRALNLYASSPGVRTKLEEYGTGSPRAQAQALAEEYNQREATARRHLENRAAIQKTKMPGFLDYIIPGEWGGPDSEALRNYPVSSPENMMDVFKADPAAKKLIRRGDAGWEPILPGMPDPVPQSSGFGGAMRQSSVLQAPASTVGSAPSGYVRVNNIAEALRLPPGTKFITPDGRLKQR